MSALVTFMNAGGWAATSLIAASFSAVNLTLNQYLKVPGHLLVFFSRLATVVFMTPFAFFIPWPQEPLFYVAVAATAVFGASADIRTFNISAQYGGGVVSRTMPLVILLSFFTWFLFDSSLLRQYLHQPLHAVGILFSLCAVMYFSSQLKKCSISTAALIAMLPALIGYTLATVLNKYAMHFGDYSGVVFGYMYLQSVVAIFITGAYAGWREKKKKSPDIQPRKILTAAVSFSLLWILIMTFHNTSMVFVPHPSYHMAVMQTAPVLIAVYYYFRKHKEEANVKAGLGVVAAIILLTLMSV